MFLELETKSVYNSLADFIRIKLREVLYIDWATCKCDHVHVRNVNMVVHCFSSLFFITSFMATGVNKSIVPQELKTFSEQFVFKLKLIFCQY
jgi:hypothetical protein